MKNDASFSCRACDSQNLLKRRESLIDGKLSSQNFAITDSDYGVTGAIYKCSECGLLQCLEQDDVLKYYEELKDPEYEFTRNERSLQAKKILQVAISKCSLTETQGARLLDVGAGSGIFLEEAEKFGFDAVGIEPSTWLAKTGRQNGLNVIEGTLPNQQIGSNFDIVLLIDVIEHVTEPVKLLQSVSKLLGPKGNCIIITPDVSSLFARLLGFRWWHYRIAHISYFNPKNLKLILHRADMRITHSGRPSWFFSYNYLRKRLQKYIPIWLIPPQVGPLRKMIFPLNLRDSIMLICERIESHE